MDFEIENNIEKSILKDLYQASNGLYPFTIYQRYKTSPFELFDFMEKFISKGIFIYENEKFYITDMGKDIVFKLVYHSKLNVGLDSNLPVEYKGQKISRDTPYVPIISYLSDDLKEQIRYDLNLGV